MRRAARTDDNQKQVVKTLRKAGVTVAITSKLGDGFPDIVCGHNKKNYLFEIKDGNKVPSKKKMTDCEIEFKDEWRGQYDVIESAFDALKIMGLI